MCFRKETFGVPVLALVIEADSGGAESVPRRLPDAADVFRAFLSGGGELAEAGLTCVDVVVATYREGRATGPASVDGIHVQRVRLGPMSVGGDEDETAVVQRGFSSLEEALAALGAWILRRNEGAPVLVIHITGGGFQCCAGIERAAGALKMACDFRGAPGVLYNILVDGGTTVAFPAKELAAERVAGVVRTLYRMASPIGELGAELMAGMGVTCTPSARFFEALPSFEISVAPRFATKLLSQSSANARSGVSACAFVAPKEGEVIDRCEDVVSIHRSQRRFAVSDGATTASYSAEWARALCRRAVESPPPNFGISGRESPDEDAELMRVWLERALDYWDPEVPWERLIRPSLFNKAKEGAGASLAGVEVSEACEVTGVKLRGWALGDSCVIHLRGTQVISSKPIDCSAKFNHVPTLLMTSPGYEAKYVRFWRNWESVLVPGDLMVLGTDAVCEYILKAMESGEGGEVVSWLTELKSESGGGEWRKFEEFVEARRRDGRMKNDDVGLIILEARRHGGES